MPFFIPFEREFAHKNQSLHTRVQVLHKQKQVPTLHRNRKNLIVFSVIYAIKGGHFGTL